MNYSEALAFTFRDEDWLKKLAIGGLFGVASFLAGLFFIFGFFIMGYYVGVLRNVINGEEKALPEWSDMSQIFLDGLLGSIIFVAYFIVIGGICALFITKFANDPYLTDFELVMSIVLISLATLIALTVFINFGLMQFAATDNFGAAFSLPGILKLVRSQLGNFMAISIFSMILNAILLCVGLGILSPFTNFWGFVVQAHLFGQCARHLQEGSTAMQTA